MAQPRRNATTVVELLRLFCVLFFMGAGYEVTKAIDLEGTLFGPLNGGAFGALIGTGLGYVLGGVLGRTTVSSVDRAAASLLEISVERIFGGVVGSVLGALAGAAIGLPLFLLRQSYISLPIYAILVLTMGALGSRVGQANHEGMLRVFGARAGMAPRRAGASLVPRVVDVSVAVDGRIVDVVRAGFLHGRMLVLKSVVDALEAMTSAADDTTRSRGQRGIQNLEALRREPGITLDVVEHAGVETDDLGATLVRYCLDNEASLLTLDTALAKSAGLAGARVMNMQSLTLALRPLVQAGDDVTVLLIKPGKEAGQAVGYLDDGTMVVAERSRAQIGGEVTIRVASVLTTANGRLVFGQPITAPAALPAESPPAR